MKLNHVKHPLTRPFASKLFATVIGCTLILAGAARAQDADWTGAASSDWNDPSNWSADTFGANLNINWYGTPPTNFPVISAYETLPHGNDIKVGEFGGTGWVDQVAGSVTWGTLNLGWAGGTGTFNLADTNAGGVLTGRATGSGSAALNTLTLGHLFMGSDGGTATVNVNTYGALSVNYDINIGVGDKGATDGVGTMNVDEGTVTATLGWIRIGFMDNPMTAGKAIGALNVSGGSVGGNRIALGIGTMDGTNASIANIGTLTINGGTVSANGAVPWGGGVSMASGWWNGDTNVNVGAPGGTATVSLNGGTLSTLYVFSESLVNNMGATTNVYTKGASGFYFNGGTLQARDNRDAPWATFMGGWPGNYTSVTEPYLTAAYVKAGGAIIDNNGYNLMISQSLLADSSSPNGAFTKNGIGTLELTGLNTFTGPITNTAGELRIGWSGALGWNGASGNYANTISLASGATLTYWSGRSQLLSGVISGDGSLLVRDGRLVLTGNNTYTGTTVVDNSGTLTMSALSSIGNTISVADGRTFGVIAAGTNQLQPSALTIGSSAGGSHLVFNNVSSTTTVAPINTAALTFTGSGNLIDVLNVSPSIVTGTYPLVHSAATISGTYALGTMPGYITGSLSDDGNTISLTITAVSALSTTGGGDWQGDVSIDWNNPVNWSGNVVPNEGFAGINGANPFTATITNDISGKPTEIVIGGWGASGRVDHKAGSLSTVNLGWPPGWVLIGYGPDGHAIYNLADTGTDGGAFTGFGTGSGTLNCVDAIFMGEPGGGNGNGSSTLNVNTTGALSVRYALSVGVSGWPGTMNLDNGTVTALELNVGRVVNGQSTQSAGKFNMSGGTATLTDRLNMAIGGNAVSNNSNTATVTISGGTLRTDDAHNAYWAAGVSMASAVWNGDTNANIGGPGGTATLNLNGGTLSTLYVFSESLVNDKGTPETGDDITYSKGNSIINFNGGSLQAQDNRDAPWGPFIQGITNLNVKSGGTIIDSAGYNLLIGASLKGDPASAGGGLTKNGAGQLELTAANTFTGPVTVNGGTLYANMGGPNNTCFSYASGVTVNTNATLRAAPNGLFGWDGSQAKPLTINAGGVAIAADSDQNVSLVTLNGGTLASSGTIGDWGSWNFGRAATKHMAVTDNSTVSASKVGFHNGADIEVAAGKTLNFSGTVTDSNDGISSVVKSGAGTLLLSGANFYTGNTTINAGIVELAQSFATLCATSTVAIATGAQLQLNDSTVTNQVVSLVTNGVPAADGLYSSANSSGFITGAGYLKVGAAPVGPSGPVHLTNSISGGVISLSWPAGEGWRLQVQTNALSVGLSTNWEYVTDGSISSTNFTVDPAKPAVFYRLVYP